MKTLTLTHSSPQDAPNVVNQAQREPGEPFCIDSLEAANWLLRCLANQDAERKRVYDQALTIVRQLDADTARLNYLYGEQLEQFAKAELARQGNRRKTLTLLQGTCAFRSAQESVQIADREAALNYARQSLQDAVQTTVTLDVARYREVAETALKTHGETLPGVEVQPARETFRVTFGKAERTDRAA